MTTCEAIAAHHRELNAKLSAEVAKIESAQSDGEGLVAYLTEELLPHASGEEAYLYPRVDDLIKRYGSATETMRLDHEEILRLSQQIAQSAQALRTARTDVERAPRRAALARLGAQLEAILSLHARKEEVVYLPLFERHIPPTEQQRILDAMHEQAGERVPGSER